MDEARRVFTPWWRWWLLGFAVLFGALELALGVARFLDGSWWSGAINFAMTLVFLNPALSARQRTEVGPEGVLVRRCGAWKARRIPASEISDVTRKTSYSPVPAPRHAP